MVFEASVLGIDINFLGIASGSLAGIEHRGSEDCLLVLVAVMAEGLEVLTAGSILAGSCQLALTS